MAFDSLSGIASYSSSANTSTVSITFTGISHYSDAQQGQIQVFTNSNYSGGKVLDFTGTSEDTTVSFAETNHPIQTRTYYVHMTRNGLAFQSTVTVANTGRKRTPTGYVDVEHVSATDGTRIHRFGGDYILNTTTTYPGYPLGGNTADQWLRNIGDDPFGYSSHYVQLSSGTKRFYKITFEQANVFLPDPFYVYYEQGHTPVSTFNFYKTGTNTLVCRLTAGSSVNDASNGRTRKRTSYAVTVYWNNV